MPGLKKKQHKIYTMDHAQIGGARAGVRAGARAGVRAGAHGGKNLARSAAAKKAAKHNPWLAFVAEFREAYDPHHQVPYKDILVLAGQAYHQQRRY